MWEDNGAQKHLGIRSQVDISVTNETARPVRYVFVINLVCSAALSCCACWAGHWADVFCPFFCHAEMCQVCHFFQVV